MRPSPNVPQFSFKKTITMKSNKVLPLVASFVTLLALDLVHSGACDVLALPGGLVQLKSQSYSLVTRMMTIPPHTLPNIEVEEFYSAWQQRSRVDYQMSGQYKGTWLETENIPMRGTIQADDQHVLLTKGFSRSQRAACSRLTHEQTLQMFTMGVLEGPDHEHDGPRHLIGPSRLLHFISNIIYKLIVVDPEVAKTDDTLMDGPNKVKLVYKLPEKRMLAVYYGQDQSSNLAHGVPHEIHLFMGTYMVVYEFKQVNLLPQNQFVADRSWSGGNRLSAQIRDLALDLFSWPRAIGCTEVLRGSEHVDKLDLVGLERHAYRFSFLARPQLRRIWEPIELNVGYEPALATLRVKRISPTRAVETATNYLQMRRYHVTRRRNKKSDIFLDSIKTMRDRVIEMTGNEQSTPDEQVSCVMTRSMPMSPFGVHFWQGNKLGDMLLGSNKFTYLGRTKVRGIDALMFESSNGEWPVWLHPPSMYYKAEKLGDQSSNLVFSRPSGGFIPEKQFVINTVIYLTATTVGAKENRVRLMGNYEEPIALDDRLLLMEIYTIHAQTKQQLDRLEVPIYEFAWHISHSGIGGKRYVDFFSLSDTCPSEANENKQHARMDLVLKIESTVGGQNGSSASKFDSNDADDNSNDGWLLDDTKRNLALLKAIHNYAGLPTTMIYDFESRLEPALDQPTGSQEEPKQFKAANSRLLVTFRVADHVRKLNELVYLGSGVMKQEHKIKFAQFSAFNFYACHMIAAHFKFNTVFAFDPTRQRCYIYVGQLGGPTVTFLIGSTFTMETETTKVAGRKLEVYETRRSPAIDREMSPIQRSALTFKSQASIRLSPISDDGAEEKLSRAPEKYVAKVSSFKTIAEGSTSGSVETRGLSNLISNEGKRLAFGLVASNAMNTLVTCTNNFETSDEQLTRAENLFRKTLGEMTFGQCKAQCLGSLECRAYSVCIRNGRVECVMTQANLRSKHLLEQLEKVASDKSAKMGAIFKLELTPAAADGEAKGGEVEQFVEVRKHPSCELHHKEYLSLVKGHHPNQVLVNLARFEPVRDREECAQRCFMKTIRTLKDEIASIDSRSMDHLKQHTADGLTLRKFYRDFSKVHLKICPSFLYLDPEHNVEDLVEKLNRMHHKDDEKDDQSKWHGFCSVAGHMDDSEAKAVEQNEYADINSEIHQMDFAFMYDKHFGVSLKESSLTTSERSAFDALMDSDTQDGADSIWTNELLQALRGFVERGENKIVKISDTDAVHCAKICFTRPLWPACKSFTIVREQDAKRNEITVSCQLNSVTLRETLERKRLDLVTNHKSASANDTNLIAYWHYEPKPNWIGRYIDWTAQLQENLDYWGPSRFPLGRTITHLSPLWLLSFTLASLILGINLGLRMGKKFILKLDTIHEDTEDLVSDMAEGQSAFNPSLPPAVPIEFRNLATCYEEPEKEAEEQEQPNL